MCPFSKILTQPDSIMGHLPRLCFALYCLYYSELFRLCVNKESNQIKSSLEGQCYRTHRIGCHSFRRQRQSSTGCLCHSDLLQILSCGTMKIFRSSRTGLYDDSFNPGVPWECQNAKGGKKGGGKGRTGHEMFLQLLLNVMDDGFRG